MNRKTPWIAAALLIAATQTQAQTQTQTQTNPIDQLLQQYRAEGASAFDPAAGEALWTQTFQTKGGARSCVDCHNHDLTRPGRHIRTRKAIKPMAPSVNGKRLSQVKKMKKWFKRNCKWTLGRECSAQEKGNLLVWLRNR